MTDPVTDPSSRSNPYDELGRRLEAAVISFRLNIGLEYALRRYVPEQAGPYWAALAEALMRELDNDLRELDNDLAAMLKSGKPSQ